MRRGNLPDRLAVALTIGTLAILFFTAAPAPASAQSESELAKQAQNPIANLSSLPIQMNITPNSGSDGGTSWVMNIQPVLPKNLGKWNLINRLILPVKDQPRLSSSVGRERGLGDFTYQAFFSPAAASETTWGIGPQVIVPTATDDVLGTEKWSIGPAFVVLKMTGRWVVGGVVSNVWSVAGDDNRDDVNFMLMQPFINYNFDKGWYLSGAPIMTANWEASSGQRWTIPPRRRIRPSVPLGQAGGQRQHPGVLQHRTPGLHRRLDLPRPAAVPVSQETEVGGFVRPSGRAYHGPARMARWNDRPGRPRRGPVRREPGRARLDRRRR